MRVANWKEALREYIDAQRRHAFAYGVHDCALFAAGAVKAQTGINYVERFGSYDEASVGTLLATHGGVSGIASKCLGEPIPPNHCCEGDIVEATLDNGPTLGICLGVNCLFQGLRGLMSRPRTVIVRGWAVR